MEYDSLLRQIRMRDKDPLLARCHQAIHSLQEELMRCLTIAREQKQQLQIVEKERQFHYEMDQKRQDVINQGVILQQRLSQLQGQQEQHEHRLKQFQALIAQLKSEVNTKDQIIELQQKELENEVRKRQKLQKKWDKAYSKVTQQITQLSFAKAKENNPANHNEKILSKPDQNLTSGSLSQRADKMVNFLNQQLALQQVYSVFKETTPKRQALGSVSKHQMNLSSSKQNMAPLTFN